MRTLPEQFVETSLTALAPESKAAFLEAYHAGEPARGLRLRPGVALETVRDALPGTYEKVPWAEEAYYIDADSRAGAHPLHAAGAYYLQEPSAMAAVPRLKAAPGHRVLDLCAAPGGKSAQLAARLGGHGVLVSNEVIPSRARVLSRNLERMGVPNALVTSEAPDALARKWGPWFDRILVDAPCSGEGMFRREPESVLAWTPASPAGCAARQLAILRAAAGLLRPGGRLVYSTCTFNAVENERVVEAFLAEHEGFALEETARLWPHEVRGEGHFVAALAHAGRAEEKPEAGAGMVSLGALLPEWASIQMEGSLRMSGGHAWLMPAVMPCLQGIRALRTGLKLGELRGKVFWPDHALALALPPEAFPKVYAADDAEAARYLRGETLEAEGRAKGFTVIAYRGLGLGWAKCVDGVLKNHLPKGLRMAYLPACR